MWSWHGCYCRPRDLFYRYMQHPSGYCGRSPRCYFSALTDNMKDATRYHDMLRDLLGEPTLEDAWDYLMKMIPYADDLVATLMTGLKSVMAS